MKRITTIILSVTFAIVFFACIGLINSAEEKNLKHDISSTIPTEIRKELEILLYSSSPLMQGGAAFQLGEWGKKAVPAVPYLVAALSHINENVRFNAVVALGKIQESSAVVPISYVLMNKEEVAKIRQASAMSLGKIDNARSVDPLIISLKDEKTRISAATALAKLGDSRAVDPLLSELENASGPKDLQAMAAALVELKTPRVVDCLIVFFSKSEDEIWAELLIKMGKPSVGPLINLLDANDVDLFRRAATALRQLKDSRAVKPLITALKDPNGDVRNSAANALGWLKDKRAVEPLILALQQDEEREARVGAAFALGELKDKRAVEPLMLALQDDESSRVRSFIYVALIKITGEDFGEDHGKWLNWWELNQ